MRLNISELHPFKNHPFQVRNDDEMAARVKSVKDKVVTQLGIMCYYIVVLRITI